MFEGVLLDTRIDARDARFFSITYVEGTNKAVFQKPIMAAPYHMDLEDFKFGDEYMTIAHHAARTAWLQAVQNDPQLNFKRITLAFPEGYKLSQRVFPGFNPSASIDGKVKAKSNTVVYKKQTGILDSAGNDVSQPHVRLVWRFVNTATRTALGLNSNDVDANDQDVRAQFAGML